MIADEFAPMPQLVNNGAELIELFQFYSKPTTYLGTTQLITGVMVDSKVRREILLSAKQGKIILNGNVYRINFVSLSNGVWNASVSKKDQVE